jgi:hypothetical protein
MNRGFVFRCLVGAVASFGQWQPLELTPTYFKAVASTVRTNSSWGTATTHAPRVESTRALTFWGHFVAGSCATANVAPVWGFTARHNFTTPLGIVDTAFYPNCAGLFGPSLEADIIHAGTPNHLIRTNAAVNGPFAAFGPAGQNPSGANARIAATYVDFNPRYQSSFANRMKPWSASYTDPARLRVAIRVTQSVTQASIPQPAVQQLQQVINLCFINEKCNLTASSSFCQISFNIKTHISGVHAYTPSSDARAFNDAGQGGLIVIVGPINSKGLNTSFKGAAGERTSVWSSWGAATQASTFAETKFQVETTWVQFQAVLRGVTEGDPAPVFGEAWNDRSAWVLLRAGYGQENFNNGNVTSTVEGMFESMELISVGS